MIERHPKQHESTGENCELCGHDGDLCVNVLREGEFCKLPWQCTREKGHDGRHAACGFDPGEHPYIEWDDEDAGHVGRAGESCPVAGETPAACETAPLQDVAAVER